MMGERHWRLGILGVVVALITASIVAPRSFVGETLLPLVFFFLVIIPAHELGHAIAGKLVGHRVVLIRLGVGPYALPTP